jgi:hypothetical protein
LQPCAAPARIGFFKDLAEKRRASLDLEGNEREDDKKADDADHSVFEEIDERVIGLHVFLEIGVVLHIGDMMIGHCASQFVRIIGFARNRSQGLPPSRGFGQVALKFMLPRQGLIAAGG